MDKIIELMNKIGVKPELATKLCEAIESHKLAFEQRKDAEYKARLEEAKKVCVETVEAHQRELARRLQIFCEAKGQAIDATLAKQAAMHESAALSKLRDIRGLLDGVVLNGGSNGDVQAENKKLKHQLRQVSEDRDKAVTLANRQTAIAERVLKRNRELEAARGTGRRVTSESTNVSVAPRRLDGGRSGGTPISTRPTLQESQTRRPARVEPAQPKLSPSEVTSPEDVARVMNELL